MRATISGARGGDNAPSVVIVERDRCPAAGSDAVKNAFDRTLKKAGFPSTGRGFYCLRKTGASLIETIDPLATEMYLSHSEPGMKKHYAERDWARLEKALKKMYKRLKHFIN